MLVWLDDVRPAPAGWVHVTTAEGAISLLEGGAVTMISLDHDLGTEKSGYDVAVWIERAAMDGRLSRVKWAVHTQNPVGRERMYRALFNADKYWLERESVL